MICVFFANCNLTLFLYVNNEKILHSNSESQQIQHQNLIFILKFRPAQPLRKITSTSVHKRLNNPADKHISKQILSHNFFKHEHYTLV